MFSYYFNIGLIYFIIGFGVALFFFFVIRRRILGNFWGALIVALIGSFLGGFFGNLFANLFGTFGNVYDTINVVPPIVLSVAVVWGFSKVSERKDS
jgi:hypothetical protein